MAKNCKTDISENTGKFLLRNLAALTNSIYCNSQRGALMNRFPVMMTPIGWREFLTIFLSEISVLLTKHKNNIQLNIMTFYILKRQNVNIIHLVHAF